MIQQNQMTYKQYAPWLRAAFLFVLALAFFSSSAFATHVRYLHLAWESAGNDDVDFIYISVFRRDGYQGEGDDGHPIIGDVVTETIGGTTLCFGDGNCTGTLDFEVTDFDVDDNFIIVRALDPDTGANRIRHTYEDDGPFVAFSESCCRISAQDFDGTNRHWNNPDGFYRVETLVDPANSTRSPRTDLEPFVTCSINEECSFPIPTLSSGRGNTTRRYRMAEPEEAGGFGFEQPEGDFEATVDPDTGEYIWDTTGADFDEDFANNLYSTQVIIEELDADDEVVEQVGIDFFVRLSDAEGDPPEFEDPEGADEPVNTTPGRPIQIFVSAGGNGSASGVGSLDDDEETFTLNVQSLPSGAEMDPPLPITGTPPVSSTFRWTPDDDQTGEELVTFRARNDATRQVSTLTYTLNVTSEALVVEEGPNPPAANIDADAGDGDVAMLQFEASVPSGSDSDVTVDELTFDTDNLEAVSAINVYTDADGQGTPGDLLGSTTAFSADDEQVTVTFDTSFVMEPGDSQVFVVTYDIEASTSSSGSQPLIALGLIPLALFGLVLVRRSRALPLIAVAFMMVILTACPAAEVAPDTTESSISLSEVSVEEEEVTLIGLPIEGSTVTIRR